MNGKVCFKCKAEKDISEFYVHHAMGDGHLGKCKECAKRDAWNHRRENPDIVRACDRRKYENKKQKDPLWQKEVGRKRKEMSMSDPLYFQKKVARCSLANAVRGGRVQRPKSCSICGIGSKRIEGHHFDYSMPLNVIWACSACHKVLDGRTIVYS